MDRVVDYKFHLYVMKYENKKKTIPLYNSISNLYCHFNFVNKFYLQKCTPRQMSYANSQRMHLESLCFPICL
jgi:hypothetical protein